ncbi:BRISC and BRCA1-A complex member 2-like [Bombyx mandarina]|uniref:BRISC and BRCA1-A complex member 2 n=2 Tax=Bombyx TaxID=7090 RepID=A0A8R2ATF2_BOMMO|nr:BRISC and BRCA1-A complex member 2 [Bombyx mori]XP_021203855.1 BRISC and BRCA1-A complex member 2 [Bombyx mori]XP_028044125.1 BRISC and BRCA1-A complex member 2-like [Bombyx mandarina]
MGTEAFGYFKNLSPAFRPYVQTLCEELKLGLCKTKIDVERISCLPDGEECQFRLLLPYCSKKLKWEILFDVSIPWFAPDFKFDDESFLISEDENFLEEKVPSLAKWNESDPRALSNVIFELVNLYKSHQIRKLSEDDSSRAYFEYSALLGDSLISESNIEVWVGTHVVEFLIKLNVDVGRLSELYSDGIEENPGIDTALLLVRYPNSTNAELILSPLLNKALGNISLPQMHPSTVLMDYVPMVTELLNRKIHDVLVNEKLKRDLLAFLVVKYEGAILEHDINSAAFLFEINDFHWILTVELGQFPEKSPILTLRSVYHSSKGKPKYKVLSSCPLNNFEEYVEQQVELFKNECKGSVTSSQLVSLEN